MCRMVNLFANLLGLVCFAVLSSTGHAALPESFTKATHKQVRVIQPTFEDQELRLNTFAIAPSGELWLCCSLKSSHEFESDAAKKAITNLEAKLAASSSSEKQSTDNVSNAANQLGRLLIYKADGTFVRSVLLGFEPQAINFADSGTPFVAGSGKVARLTKEGELDLAVLAPNLQSEEEMKKLSEVQQKKMVEQMLRTQKMQVSRIQIQISALEQQNKKDQKNSNVDERVLERNEKRLELLQKSLATQEEKLKTVEEDILSKVAESTNFSRMSRTSGLAVSPTDVFVSLNSFQGNRTTNP